MRKASFFLTVAAGLIASLAFSAPIQAGSINYDANFTVIGGTASDIYVFYSAPITSVTLTSNPIGATETIVNSGPLSPYVEFTFSPISTGDIKFTIVSTGESTGGLVDGLSPGYTHAQLNLAPTVVPEPASMALLGIGMAGFLAYRRLFKRAAIA